MKEKSMPKADGPLNKNDVAISRAYIEEGKKYMASMVQGTVSIVVYHGDKTHNWVGMFDQDPLGMLQA